MIHYWKLTVSFIVDQKCIRWRRLMFGSQTCHTSIYTHAIRIVSALNPLNKHSPYDVEGFDSYINLPWTGLGRSMVTDKKTAVIFVYIRMFCMTLPYCEEFMLHIVSKCKYLLITDYNVFFILSSEYVSILYVY